ncbi:MAG TPA: bifunctional serine/threonine-protein kinase/universal stress protein [Polyangiaceae bacterium]|nr:bifunctional serine/threonine-protein kinase/universal stress protein [Polyangiaceae bacterium]
MTSNRWQPGATLDGFTLGERIHAGGMGAIFRVSKPGLTLPAVMKLPRLEDGQAAEAVVAFQTEAMIAPTLKGPHVPAFVAAGELATTPYLVIEWIDGECLEDICRRAPLPALDVARIGAALADALHAVHLQQVIHLDFKPSNAILRADGNAVLIDFGFAHHAQLADLLAEETRYRAGSAPYVSPEQLLGSREDSRSDLFALGVVLYELLTGKLPFGEPDADVRNRFWIEPVPPTVLAPDTPAWLQEVILRLLEPRAELRYQSAAHVAFDLRNPEQVTLSERASKQTKSGVLSHVGRFLRARAEFGARLRAPEPLANRTPIVLVAVDTENLADERHPAIRAETAQILAQSSEFRLLCLAVITPRLASLDHLVRLQEWVAPLELPAQRVSLHAIESVSPSETIVQIARHNNVDRIVIGAPREGGRAWANSTASHVTANAGCSVHVVRVPKL